MVLLPIPDSVLHIGRSPAAGLTLDDATVSRRHALIVHDDQGTHVLDDRSLNGLVVSGRRVKSHDASRRHVIDPLPGAPELPQNRFPNWLMPTIVEHTPSSTIAQAMITSR